MKLKDILNKCSYPVWVNVESPGRSWTYGEMNCDDKRLEALRGYEVCYITTDVMGNLVIEVKEEYMTVQEYKSICNAIITGSHEADDPKSLPDDRHRCYWHGFGEGVAMAMEKLAEYVVIEPKEEE